MSIACDSVTEHGLARDLASIEVRERTPAQWLFGRDRLKEVASVPMPAAMTAQSELRWTAALDRAGSLDTQAPVATGGAQVTHVVAAARIESAETAQRFLVEEWRRTELAVADSVHHANIQQLVTAFDSLGRPGVPDSTRVEGLRRLDRLNHANQFTWLMFKAEIIRRADSAMARLGPASGR